jgi:hypothetical protein
MGFGLPYPDPAYYRVVMEVCLARARKIYLVGVDRRGKGEGEGNPSKAKP